MVLVEVVQVRKNLKFPRSSSLDYVFLDLLLISLEPFLTTRKLGAAYSFSGQHLEYHC